MKKVLRIAAIPAVLLLLSLTSCKSGDTKQDLAKIDSLLLRLDSVWLQYKAIDSSEFLASYKHFMVMVDSFNLYFDDNRQDTAFEIISRFAEARSPLRNAARMYSQTAYDIVYSGGQLRALREDVARKRWKEEELRAHLHSEIEAIIRLESEVLTLQENIRRGLKIYNDELPAMRRVIRAMSVKRGNE